MTLVIDDNYLDALEDDMVRLSRRIYAEEGVPMYLVPEDLTANAHVASPAADAEGEAMAELFTALITKLEARNGPLSTSDISQLLEVLADRHFLDQPFSKLSE